MVERRPCSWWMALLLAGLVCLSVWQIIGCPGPPRITYLVQQQASYTLLNATHTSPYDLDRLPADDYQQLMNLSDFSFTMLASVCNDSAPLLLVLVHSAPGNVRKRDVIRATWGSPRDKLRLVFLVGAVNDSTRSLVSEQRLNGDLVQGSFRDAYRNMTYKHVMALKYAAYHCPRARYVLKTDDDVFVNMPTMMAFLSEAMSPWGARRLLFCDTLWESYPKRSWRSKWRVSFKEYRGAVYPPYCPGWTVLYSPDVVFMLYREAQRSNYFWIDDVLLTGILAKRLQVEHTKIASKFIMSGETLQQLMQDNCTSDTTDVSFLYGPLDMKPNQIHALWKIINSYH